MSEQADKYQEEEITLKELVIKIKYFIHEIARNFLLVLIITLPILAYFLYNHYNTFPKYEAETRFLVEGSSGSGGLGSILGQFGIRSSGKFNPYKVIEVAKSKSLLKKVLFTKNEGDYIINDLIEDYKLDEKWAKTKPEWKGFKFKSDDFSKFTLMENQAFINIYTLIVGGKKSKEVLLNFNFDEDTGVYNYNVSTKDEALSLAIINHAYEELKHFFEEEIISNQLSTTVILRQKADSIQSLITRKSYQLASQNDRTLGLVVSTPGVKKATLEKEIQALTLAYAEVLKSFEMADINLKDTRPMFLKLDETYAPIEAVNSSLLISIIKGLLIGGVLASVYIIGRSIYREAMA